MIYVRLIASRPDGTPLAVLQWDFQDYYYPALTYLGDAIQAHIFPLWCPYVRAGTPFFIHPQAQLYSPVTLLIAPLLGYSERIAQLQEVYTFLLGGVGAYLLSWTLWRSRWSAFATAVAYTFTTAVFSNAEHMTVVNAVSLSPWLLWAVTLWVRDRRWWALPVLSALVYWQITWGYPGVVLMTFLWTAVYFLWRILHDRPAGARASGLAAGAAFAALGVGLAAVLWLPIMVHRDTFTRGEALPIDKVLGMTNGLSFKHLLGMLFSFHTMTPVVGTDIDVSQRGLYFGALALPLAMAGLCVREERRQARALAIGAGVALLMACGGAFFGRFALHTWIPFLNFSRFPASDSRMLAVLGFALLAGLGVRQVAAGDSDASNLVRAGVKGLMIASTVGLFLYWWWSPKAYGDAILPTIILELALFALVLLGLQKFRPHALAMVCVAVLVLELGWAINLNFAVAGFDPGAAKWAQMQAQHERSFTTDHVEEPRRGPASQQEPTAAAAAYLEKSFYLGEYNHFRLTRYQRLLENGFTGWLTNGKRVVFFAGEVPGLGAAFEAQAQAVRYTTLSYEPNRVEYEVHADRDGTLVFNEVFFPGWQAFVDGAEVQVKEVAGALRAVPITAGDHRIVTRFRPGSFVAGLVGSLASAALTVAAALWVRRRRAGANAG